MPELVQVSKHEGRINRVRPGVVPVVELCLEPYQHVVSMELREACFVAASRKTTDWVWTAYIATRLELVGVGA